MWASTACCRPLSPRCRCAAWRACAASESSCCASLLRPPRAAACARSSARTASTLPRCTTTSPFPTRRPSSSCSCSPASATSQLTRTRSNLPCSTSRYASSSQPSSTRLLSGLPARSASEPSASSITAPSSPSSPSSSCSCCWSEEGRAWSSRRALTSRERSTSLCSSACRSPTHTLHPPASVVVVEKGVSIPSRVTPRAGVKVSETFWAETARRPPRASAKAQGTSSSSARK
mmetsp:Transcript_18203/g.43852  ORF Transcript_18203/g.43852 Transcript_18203/m.43852 type:complete len:233 (+) Transcript_18203:404-1102(+)